MSDREYISQLRADPRFQALIREVLVPQGPTVPEYTPNEDDPEGRWKYGSGLRAGYLLAFKHLGVEID